MTTRVRGTLGYLAPEYAMWGKVSESCDVFSFGILLLELVSGRKPIEKLPDGLKRTITEWAGPFITQGRFKDLVDPSLRGNYDENQVKHVIHVAALCVQNEPHKRPNMKQVVHFLKGWEPQARVMKMMRIDSVKYSDELLALDQTSEDDDGGGGGGVFSALDVQKMHHPYKKKMTN